MKRALLSGEYKIISSYDRLLQSWIIGDLHCTKNLHESNNQNIWIINYVEGSSDLYTIQNKQTEMYLSIESSGMVVANRFQPSEWEHWEIKYEAKQKKFTIKSFEDYYLYSTVPIFQIPFFGNVCSKQLCDISNKHEMYFHIRGIESSLYDIIHNQGNPVDRLSAKSEFVDKISKLLSLKMKFISKGKNDKEYSDWYMKYYRDIYRDHLIEEIYEISEEEDKVFENLLSNTKNGSDKDSFNEWVHV